MAGDITLKDGHYYGGWRAVKNPSFDHKGSIHDEETAKKLGMRGGAVAGVNHLNLFPPLLADIFGRRWFETGTLSIFYTFATRDREEVRAVIGGPPKGRKDAQVEAWIEMKDGTIVGRGTVAVGKPKEKSYIMSVVLEDSPPEDLRILKGLKAGDALPPKDVTVTQKDIDAAIPWLSDTMDWFKGESPWGKSLLPIRNLFNCLAQYPAMKIDAVAFYGGTEIRILSGPALVDVPYYMTGKIACVGATTKTEFYWYDSELTEKSTGKVVAQMRHMQRVMKASSPLYRAAP